MNKLCDQSFALLAGFLILIPLGALWIVSDLWAVRTDMVDEDFTPLRWMLSEMRRLSKKYDRR